MAQSGSYWWLFYLVRAVLRIGFRLFFRAEYHGAHHVPASGGCIIAGNHVSYLDPPLIGCAARRPLRFVGRDTLFRFRFSSWFFRSIRLVPLDRTRGDVAALRAGIRVVRDGDGLALFPEGTRSPDGQLQPAKGGIGFLVSKSQVPVVPVYVQGTFEAYPKAARLPRPRKVRVFFGPPIMPEAFAAFGKGREAYERMAGLIMERIAALRDEAEEKLEVGSRKSEVGT